MTVIEDCPRWFHFLAYLITEFMIWSILYVTLLMKLFLRSTVISPNAERETRIRFEFPDAISSDEEVDPLITNAMREYDKYTDWFHETLGRRSDPEHILFENDYFDHV